MKISNIGQMGGGKRLAYLDAIKCLGILLVIIGHVQLFGMKIEAYDSIPTLMLYSFNMPLFFFISGYLAYREEIGKFDELKKIGSKFVFLVIPAIAFYSFSMFQQHGNGIFDFISDGLGKYWFTFTLFEIFLIYYIASGVSKSKYMLAVILVILSVTKSQFWILIILQSIFNFSHWVYIQECLQYSMIN